MGGATVPTVVSVLAGLGTVGCVGMAFAKGKSEPKNTAGMGGNNGEFVDNGGGMGGHGSPHPIHNGGMLPTPSPACSHGASGSLGAANSPGNTSTATNGVVILVAIGLICLPLFLCCCLLLMKKPKRRQHPLTRSEMM